jgi:hypothetical protein
MSTVFVLEKSYAYEGIVGISVFSTLQKAMASTPQADWKVNASGKSAYAFLDSADLDIIEYTIDGNIEEQEE